MNVRFKIKPRAWRVVFLGYIVVLLLKIVFIVGIYNSLTFNSTKHFFNSVKLRSNLGAV